MPAGRRNPFRELGAGVADLGRGFAVWGTSPRLMLLGAVPATRHAESLLRRKLLGSRSALRDGLAKFGEELLPLRAPAA